MTIKEEKKIVFDQIKKEVETMIESDKVLTSEMLVALIVKCECLRITDF